MYGISKVDLTLGIAIGIVLGLLIVALAGDVAWCHINYPVTNIPHCLWYENSLFGQFIHP